MNNLKIYWTSMEYSYSKQSAEYKKLAGGFVYGFVKAFDEKEALKKFTEELNHQYIEIKEVEFISLYDIKTVWETEEQTRRFIQLYEEAETSNEVFFDTFYAYEKEEQKY